MKKLFFVAIAIAAFSFTSCMKEYTCTCVYDDDTWDDAVYTAEFKKKTEAEDWCNLSDTEGVVECELD